MPGSPHECYFHEVASYIFILYLYGDICICGLYTCNLWIVVRGRLSGWLAVGIGSYRNMDGEDGGFGRLGCVWMVSKTP